MGSSNSQENEEDVHKTSAQMFTAALFLTAPPGGSTQVHQLVDRTLEIFLHWIQLRLLPQRKKVLP